MADGDETGERERRAAANNVALYYFQGQHMTFLCLFAFTPVPEALFLCLLLLYRYSLI